MQLSPSELREVERLMSSAGEDMAGELRSTILSGGRSNLTYVIEDGASKWVLRTPPRVGRTPSAHDIGREFRVTQALAPTAVPVARQVVSFEDDSILGVPFTIADFVEGQAIRTQQQLAALEDQRLNSGIRSMLRALASLHSVDPHEVGLTDFGRPDGYAARQLRRWSGQWDHVATPESDRAARSLTRQLAARLPDQRFSRIVHGDFRIDNTILESGAPTHVAAIVDWELSTIGDPVADVAMMCAYRHPAFDLIVGEPSAWTSDRLPSGDDLANMYVEAGGIDLDNWPFHLGLAYFKIGVIAAGIDHRRRAGSGLGPGFDTAGHSVAAYFELAESALKSTPANA